MSERCNMCGDLFPNLDEFARHMRSEHFDLPAAVPAQPAPRERCLMRHWKNGSPCELNLGHEGKHHTWWQSDWVEYDDTELIGPAQPVGTPEIALMPGITGPDTRMANYPLPPTSAPEPHVVKNVSTEKGRDFWNHVESIAAQNRGDIPPTSAPTPETRKCEVCNYAEPGWRFNRCPNCGEMAIPPTSAPIRGAAYNDLMEEETKESLARMVLTGLDEIAELKRRLAATQPKP